MTPDKILNWTGYIYGGLAHSAHIRYDRHSEEVGEASVRRALRRMGVDPADVAGMRVLETGSGWYGLGFQRLGADVEHHNIATRTIEALADYARERGYENLRCFETDLVTDPLPAERFDIVYLSGVFQHLSNPARALQNICRSLAPGGLLYLDHYRSGRWRWFVVDTLRRIARKRLLNGVLDRFTDFCALGRRRSFDLRQVELLIDDLFVEHVHLFHPDDLIADARALGLEPTAPATSMNLVDPPETADHSLFFAHVFNTLVLRKGSGAASELSSPRTVRGRDQIAEIRELPGSYRHVGDITAEFLLAHQAGRFSRSETISQIVNLYRMAHPCLPEDPYFIAGDREPAGSTSVTGSAGTAAARHSAWCSFLANSLGAGNPMPEYSVVSLGYELRRFEDKSRAAVLN